MKIKSFYLKYLKIFESLCVLLLLVFIGVNVFYQKPVSTTPEQVAQQVIQTFSTDSLEQKPNRVIAQDFGINEKQFQKAVYYSSDDVMNVRRVLVVQLKENDDGAEWIQKLEQYVSDRLSVFDGYARQQSELLKNYVLKQSGNFVFFAICENAHQAQDAFLKAIGR